MAATDQQDVGTAPPGAPGDGKRTPASPTQPGLTDADEVPDHDGALRAQGRRMVNRIVWRLAAEIDRLLDTLDDTNAEEVFKKTRGLLDMLHAAKDIQQSDLWTERLIKEILAKAQLLQQSKGKLTRQVGGFAAQVQKEQKTDGRTVPARNKKHPTVGRFTDMPGAEQA